MEREKGVETGRTVSTNLSRFFMMLSNNVVSGGRPLSFWTTLCQDYCDLLTSMAVGAGE